MMKLWICENHIYELRSEELYEGWSRVYNETIQRPAVSLIGRALHAPV